MILHRLNDQLIKLGLQSRRELDPRSSITVKSVIILLLGVRRDEGDRAVEEGDNGGASLLAVDTDPSLDPEVVGDHCEHHGGDVIVLSRQPTYHA